MFKMKKLLLLLTLTLVTTALAFGQKTITGTITDASNKEPLVGASVTVKGN
jgi:hypothetical protein